MFLRSGHIRFAFVFLTVYTTTIAFADPYPGDEKTFNLKIGFDLTHGENGAPALRIRDFEDSKEFNPRAAEDDDFKKAPEGKQEAGVKKDDVPKKLLRGGSSSSSSESDALKSKKSPSSNESAPKTKKDKNKSKDGSKEAASDNSGSGDSEPDAKRSTRGLGDAEPEDVYKPRPVARENDDDDDDRRRRKRSAEIRRLHKRAAEKFIEHYYENIKRKHKKAHIMPMVARRTSYKPY